MMLCTGAIGALCMQVTRHTRRKCYILRALAFVPQNSAEGEKE